VTSAPPNKPPLDPQYGYPTLPETSLGCHSCRRINQVASSLQAHNPKVAGSNPAPATKREQRPKAVSSLFYCGYELSLHSYLSDLVAASLFLFSELRTFENKSP